MTPTFSHFTMLFMFMILLIGLLPGSLAICWDLNQNFSQTDNAPNQWRYGHYIIDSTAPPVFELFEFPYQQPYFHYFKGWSQRFVEEVDTQFTAIVYIAKNQLGDTVYGIGPRMISMDSSQGTPCVRWIAPIDGFYTIDAKFGGTLTDSYGGGGNVNAILSGLKIDGYDQQYTSFENNIKYFGSLVVYLHENDIVDAFVDERYGFNTGNTQAQFSIASGNQSCAEFTATTDAVGVSSPSSQPTQNPTSPSGQPTSKPSLRPSSQPSSEPTCPTSQPSASPTSPTSQPTSQPTHNYVYSPGGASETELNPALFALFCLFIIPMLCIAVMGGGSSRVHSSGGDGGGGGGHSGGDSGGTSNGGWGLSQNTATGAYRDTQYSGSYARHAGEQLWRPVDGNGNIGQHV